MDGIRSIVRLLRAARGLFGFARASWFLASLAALIGVPIVTIHAQPSISWERWQHLEGIVDVGGPRSDGALVAMAAGRLYLLSTDGTTSPFAAGADGYSGPPEAEPYFVAAPALPSQSPDCGFVRDEIFILDLGTPTGVIRVDAAGRASRF